MLHAVAKRIDAEFSHTTLDRGRTFQKVAENNGGYQTVVAEKDRLRFIEHGRRCGLLFFGLTIIVDSFRAVGGRVVRGRNGRGEVSSGEGGSYPRVAVAHSDALVFPRVYSKIFRRQCFHAETWF